MRILFVLILTGFVCYWLFRSFVSGFKKALKTSSNDPTQGAVPLVACKQCGLHLPLVLAIKTEEGYFCDKEHEERSARTK